jgi:3-oxoacyl-[acyl-carrier protein] reductase
MTENKVILVTGGTRGIGKAIAERFASFGASIFLSHASPDSPGVSETLASLKDKGASLAEAKCWRTEDEEAAKEAIREIKAKCGKLDVLINNAGVTKDGLSIKMTREEFTKVMETNLWGVFSLSRIAGREMLKARSGRIINISSIVGFTGNPGQANYASSKAGVIGLTKTLALEYAPRGVTVNAVAPGFIETDMTSKLPQSVQENFLSRIPLGYFGKPADVAEAVFFLASDSAAYITGQTIHVNGGLYMA